MKGVILRAEQLSFDMGDSTLLFNITLALRRGTVHALVGPNGAGKSTLLHMLAGNAQPTTGRIFIDDAPLSAYSKAELALRRAVMPQDVALSLAFTGEEVVMMGRYPHTMARRRVPRPPSRAAAPAQNGAASPNSEAKDKFDHRQAVRRAMEQTDTIALAPRLYPTLSGGEQARVSLARVLAQATPILFLDEPTASLDPRHQHLVMAVARRHAQRGGSALVVLHDLNLAAAYADDVLLLHKGRLRAQGRPGEVLQATTLEEVFQTRFFVGSAPGLPHPLVVSLPVTD